MRGKKTPKERIEMDMSWRKAGDVVNGRRVLIPIESCDMTLAQVMGWIKVFMYCRPNDEVFMDGDLYAIVSQPMPRGVRA